MLIMLTLKEIRKRLEDRNLTVISERTGVSYQTLWRITKTNSTPNAATAEKLSKYLENNK
jgi:transcriptional regulator with XRE-family HTH domain